MAVDLDVIIVTFERPQFLYTLLGSLACQSKLPSKVIIYDDCSCDGTRALYADFKFPSLDIEWVLGDVKSSTVAESRNKAFHKSNADVIIFSDDDDIFSRDRVRQTLNEFSRDSNLSFLLSGFYYFKVSDGLVSSKRVVLTRKNLSWRDFVGGNRFNFCTLALRRQSFVRAGYWDSSLRIIIDWVLYCRLTEFGEGRYLDIPLSYYRIHPNNYSKNLLLKVNDFSLCKLPARYRASFYRAKVASLTGKIDLWELAKYALSFRWYSAAKILGLYVIGRLRLSRRYDKLDELRAPDELHFLLRGEG